MKYLGIDYGRKRTGVAISDEEGNIAIAKETIVCGSQHGCTERITAIVGEENVNMVIVGLPMSMKNASTRMTEEVERFVAKLRDHLEVPVQTTDERLTSSMANQLLRGVKKPARDQVAAQILLQNFLDRLHAA